MNINIKYILFGTTFLLSTIATAQEKVFFIGENTYPATKTFSVGTDCSMLYNENLSLSFIKDGIKGMIAFEKGEERVNGTILFYLDDNSVIKLYDRNKWDYVDDRYTCIYYLTSPEIEKLKSINIRTIRYNLSSKYGGSSAKTVNNKVYTCKGFDGEYRPKERLDFPKIIKELFK